MSRKCENCASYDAAKEAGFRCSAFYGGRGPSFEGNVGDCNCVYFKLKEEIG